MTPSEIRGIIHTVLDDLSEENENVFNGTVYELAEYLVENSPPCSNFHPNQLTGYIVEWRNQQ